jgi:hypothetical protein
MGHRSKNFLAQLMARRGFADEADRIQELYLAGHKAQATAAVPDDYVDMKSLVGPATRIRERYKAWADSGATSLILRKPDEQALQVMADIALQHWIERVKTSAVSARRVQRMAALGSGVMNQ